MPMTADTMKAMVKRAYENGVCDIVYDGVNSGGLYSSSSASVRLYLSKYPGDKKCYKVLEKDARIKMDDYLDKLEVKEGFIEITLNSLYKSDSKNPAFEAGPYQTGYDYRTLGEAKFTYPTSRDDKEARGNSRWATHTFKTLLIPFDRIVSILI